MAVDGNRAYLPHGAAGMFVVDVSQPSLPEVGLYDTFGNPSDVIQVGDYLYLVDYYDDLHILSTTLPLSPTEVGRYRHQSWRWQLQKDGGDVFLVGSNGFEILDVSDPISPVQKSAYQTLSRLQELIVQGDYVYLAISEYYSSDSLQIVDISDRTQPTMTASTGFGCHSGVGLQVAGGYAFLAEDSYCSPQPSGLAVVNVSNPTQPQIVVSQTISGSLNGLAMLNDRLYLANDGYGIRIVDVTDPLSPTESGLYTVTNATGYGYDVHVVDGQLYVHTRLTDGSVAREILDVSDPDNPVKIGTYEYAVGLSLSQEDRHYIYRPLSSKGLYIFGEGAGTVPERNVYLPAVTR